MEHDDNAQFAPPLMIDSADERTDSPGRQLRYARERRGMTLERVASDLRLTVATVTALENDDYTGLPSPVFVSGYLSSYARLVNLDPAPLLERYRGIRPAVNLPVCGPALPKNPTMRSNHVLMRLMSGVVILALTSGVTLWWINHRPHESVLPPATPATPVTTPPVAPTTPTNVVVPLPLPNRPAPPASDPPVVPPTSAPLPAAPSPPSNEPRPQRGRGESDGLVAAATAADATAIASAPPPIATPPPPAPRREVAVSFNAPCWVDIRDASGRFKLIGEMRKGARHVLAGEPPYSIIFGNATAVDMRIDGKTFNVRAKSRGNIARFDFNPSQSN